MDGWHASPRPSRQGRHDVVTARGARGGETAGRVIAGSARGVRLVGPGEGTRPLGDRMKQSLFAILEPTIRGRAFLDLFAGSGAAGIEALSRGAASAVFIERHRGAVEAIGRNLAATNLRDGRATVVKGDVTAWLRRAAAPGRPLGRFAAILVDSPYDQPQLVSEALGAVEAAGADAILASDGVLVAKHPWRVALPGEVGLLRSSREERFGETILTFYRWAEEVAA